MPRIRVSPSPMCALLNGAALLFASILHAAPPTRLIIDMVHLNPGEGEMKTAFLDPKVLADWGYNGQALASMAGTQTLDALAPGALPEHCPEREWILQKAATLESAAKAAHAAGLRCYAWTDLFVIPKPVVKQLRAEICNDKGRIDIHRPKTREMFREMMRETFARCPDLDGVIIRTGEVYLHDFPYHTGSGGDGQAKMNGSTAILRGAESHIELLKILREEVCAKLGKTVIYRTWDFGPQGFHESPDYYLKVTNAIEPHPNLIFSVKHQKGDFHQLTPFNPTLMIGRHRQIVEVQCQREAYGKGAHPYYIGQGVIEGWEEYAWLMKPDQPKGLRDIIRNPLCAGVWTWTRGGGWEGPYITNELWCGLNAYVISKFAQDPSRTEAAIFAEYCRHAGLDRTDAARFRELCLLSAKAVLRGQLTTLGAKIDVWWARDHFLGAPDLGDFIRKGLAEKAIAEKAEAVAMWKSIESLARQIHFPDAETREFVETSTTYGRIKYDIIAQGWTILLLGAQGDAAKQYDTARISAAITAYDKLWSEFRALKAARPSCATLPNDFAFGNKPGLGAAVNRYRKVAGLPATSVSGATR